MFKVVDRHSCQLVGVFPEAELQQFDIRCYEITPVEDVKPGKPILLRVHVQQRHMDESGSRFRETEIEVNPGLIPEGLQINASGQLIKLL